MVPLLPGYLSYTTGLSGADLADARRGRMLAGSLLFVLGFSFVFVSYGALIGAVGEWLFTYERQITVVLGILTILLGLVFLGVVPWMQRDWRIHQVPAVGLAAAPLLGVLFGLGWAPCIGPTLTAVTALALNEGSAGRGALLSFVYCLGLGLPFIVAALAYRHMLGTVRWVRRHQQWVTAFGGADADRRRPAARHRLVGRGGRLDAHLVLPRLHGRRLRGHARNRLRARSCAAPEGVRPLDVAAAHLDADGADPAVPAGARGDPRVGGAAGGGRLGAGVAVAASSTPS